VVVVHAGETQDGVRDIAMLALHRPLGLELRLRVCPGRCKGRVLPDRHAGFAWTMHQHRAGIEKLLDPERLQVGKEAARSLDVYPLVERVLVTAEIEIGGEVYDRSDIPAVFFADRGETPGDGALGAEVDRPAARALLHLQ